MGDGTVTDGEIDRLKAIIVEKDAKIADLESVLGLHENNLGVAFKLSTSLSKLLGCLLKTPNVTPEMIMTRLNIATDAKVAIHRLREALKPHGIEIKGRRGLGYWIEQDDKEKIEAITSQVTKPVLVVDNTAVA